MSLQPQTSLQARCQHTRVTSSGSNDVQERRTCRDCRLTLCMVHYARATDDWYLQVLNHVREHRPHLWEEASRRRTTAEVHQAARDLAARDLAAQNQMGVDNPPPPEPHPAPRPMTRTIFPAGRLSLEASGTTQVVINNTSPMGDPTTLGPQSDPTGL